jgi:hypothetical protein
MPHFHMMVLNLRVKCVEIYSSVTYCFLPTFIIFSIWNLKLTGKLRFSISFLQKRFEALSVFMSFFSFCLKKRQAKRPIILCKVFFLWYFGVQTSFSTVSTKSQLISKTNFEVFIWAKKRTKIFLYICSSL